MSEKYNIPEPNSLDSMEGIELENGEKDSEKNEEIISPEQIQKVVDMVVDIKTSGFAYHAINGTKYEAINDFNIQLEGLLKILKFGLLGTRHGTKKETDDEIKTNFIDSIKNTPDQTRVFANIIGRDVWPRELIQRQYDNGWGTGEIVTYWKRPISLLFDISDREEVIPGRHRYTDSSSDPDTLKSKGLKLNHMWGKFDIYRPHDMISVDYPLREDTLLLSKEEVDVLSNLEILRDGNNVNFEDFKKQIYSHEDELKVGIDFEKLKAKLEEAEGFGDIFRNPDTDDGFVVGKRIAPRKFRGIIYRASDRKSFEENNSKDTENVLRIIETLASNDNKAGLIPIYDQWGNLWWPKRISHEEIIKNNDAREGSN